MKESELKDYERVALRVYRDSKFIADSPHSALYQFGKEIAEKLEPELKPVDMSVLVNSGIDCVFNSEELGLLTRIDGGKVYLCGDYSGYGSCKPRMNYWFSALNFEDSIELRSDLETAGFDLDVASNTGSFRIIGLQDGYCWPWEVE